MTPTLLAITLLAWPQINGWSNDVRTFEWTDDVAVATSYRFRYGTAGNAWCEANKYEVPLTQCQDIVPPPVIPRRCLWPHYPIAGWNLTFIVVTPMVGTVEGPTEHGAVMPCP